MNLAIFSPNKNPYSETFIQAHKNYIQADKLFYIYGRRFQNMQIEHQGLLISLKQQLFSRVKAKITKQPSNKILEPYVAQGLRGLKIDVALVEYGTHAMNLLSVFKKSGIPFVVHFHGYDASVKSVVVANDNYSQLFKAAHSVVAVSTVMQQALIDMGCPKEKVVYNVYGANPIFLERQPQFTKKQAVGIGRFVDKKAPYYTILAFKKVVEKHKDAQLVMAGQGVLWPTCKNLVKHLGLEKNIQLLGVVPSEEVAQLMQESYCFVQHSITADSGDQEGTPLAVLESALSGIPVVATYHAGIPDVIEHERTGLLGQEHDVDKMAENLIRIFDDVNFAKQLGQAAREEHRIKYSLDRHIGELESLLIKAANSSVS